eukprot:gene6391-9626_t
MAVEWTCIAHFPSFHPLLPVIAHCLTRACDEHDKLPKACTSSRSFDGTSNAPMSLAAYMFRLCRHGHSSSTVWIVMYLLLS